MSDFLSPRIAGFYSQPYQDIVRPDQIWPVSKYFLRRWAPYLGPARFWVVIAARQLAYRMGDRDRFNSYDSLLYEEAGLSRANFYRVKAEMGLTNSPISLFLSRGQIKYHRQDDVTKPGPTDYYVRLDDILTPGDASYLASWLQMNNHRRKVESVLGLLTEALALPAGTLLAPSLIPYLAHPPSQFQALTVADIVGHVFGSKIVAESDVLKAAEALHSHLTGALFIGTHYFRKYWLDLLGYGPAFLITYLRSLCYRNEKTSEVRDLVTFTRPELAHELGIDRITLFRWLKKIESFSSSETSFSSFLQFVKNYKMVDNEVELTYRVQLYEPLIPDHVRLYSERLAEYELLAQSQGIPEALVPLSGLNGGEVAQQQLAVDLDSYQYLTVLAEAIESNQLKHSGPQKPRPELMRTLLIADKIAGQPTMPTFAQAILIDFVGFCDAVNIQGQKSRNLVAHSGLTLEEMTAWYLYALDQKGLDEDSRPGYLINRASEKAPPPADFYLLASLSWELWRCYACLLELPWSYRECLQDAPAYQIWMAQYGQQKADDLPLLAGQKINEFVATLIFEDGPANDLSHLMSEQLLGLTIPSDEERVIWQIALGELEQQMSKATFDAWLKDSYLLGREDETWVIAVNNEYAQDWLANRLYGAIMRTMTAISQTKAQLRFVTWQPTRSGLTSAPPLPSLIVQ